MAPHLEYLRDAINAVVERLRDQEVDREQEIEGYNELRVTDEPPAKGDRIFVQSHRGVLHGTVVSVARHPGSNWLATVEIDDEKFVMFSKADRVPWALG